MLEIVCDLIVGSQQSIRPQWKFGIVYDIIQIKIVLNDLISGVD